MNRRVVLLPFVLLACRDTQRHAFQAPPPPMPARALPAAAPPAPDAPAALLGSKDPEARITAVTDADTGVPASLTNISTTFQVMSVVARGKYDYPPGALVYIDVAVRGTRDTTIAFYMGSPAPSIIAHSFEVPVARGGQPGLRAGFYSARVRLMVNERPMVSSAPIYFTVP